MPTHSDNYPPSQQKDSIYLLPRMFSSGIVQYLFLAWATAMLVACGGAAGTAPSPTTPSGLGPGITVITGTGRDGLSGDGGPAAQAQLRSPKGLAVDRDGNLYIADWGNHRVRKIDAETGIITTIAGTTRGFSGDNGPATSAQLRFPISVAVDAEGNIYTSDSTNNRVRMVQAASGVISTVAGTGEYDITNRNAGDGGPATRALLSTPQGLAIDPEGNLLIADRDRHRIRRVAAATGIITTIAGGSGREGFGGDNGPAIDALLAFPSDIATDHQGNIFIADTGNNRIRRIDAATGVITTVAGPEAGSGIQSPRGIALDREGDIFIANEGNNLIRGVDAQTLAITTVAGPAGLRSPQGIAFDQASNLLYIADTGNHRILQMALP